MNELIITPPTGFVVDKEKSTFEKIIFKPINNKPRSWEEYCNTHKGSFYFINGNGLIEGMHYDPRSKFPLVPKYSKNTLPSEELAESFLAMMQLMSLRQAWIKDWEFTYNSTPICIFVTPHGGMIYIGSCSTVHPLSFPDREMAQDFFNCFQDLIKQAKPLL